MKGHVRARRRGRVFEYNPLSLGGYDLPPQAREGIQKLVDNDLFWEYVDQLRVLKEKQQAIQGYMDTIIKRIQRELKEGRKGRIK